MVRWSAGVAAPGATHTRCCRRRREVSRLGRLGDDKQAGGDRGLVAVIGQPGPASRRGLLARVAWRQKSRSSTQAGVRVRCRATLSGWCSAQSGASAWPMPPWPRLNRPRFTGWTAATSGPPARHAGDRRRHRSRQSQTPAGSARGIGGAMAALSPARAVVQRGSEAEVGQHECLNGCRRGAARPFVEVRLMCQNLQRLRVRVAIQPHTFA